MKTLNHPFFLDMQRGAQEAADRAGIQLVVQAAEREIDVEKQMQIIENLLQTGIAALIVTPSGSREIASAIAKANRANVPVIVVDTRVDPKAAADNKLKIASFIGSDNYEGGRLAGEYLAKATGGKARVAVLEGIPGHETGDSRLRGFRDAARSTHPGMTIVASQPANWERDQGFTVFQNMLQAHPRHRRAVRLQRPDGARRGRGDCRGRTLGTHPRRRLRRAGRCPEGDRGGADGGVGGAVAARHGPARGRERRDGCSAAKPSRPSRRCRSRW